ncbi:MAG: cysteine protease [Betaproteobacteria bacterium]|nr:cysteine protease [Betaproteobacteria bacterium]
MIFINPRGAPELACDHCGCRWVDRLKGVAYCYECGEEITAAAIAEFQQALAEFAARTPRSDTAD